MKKEGKNLDDLLKEKLAGGAFPFKEAYWDSAQQVMKANGLKAATGFTFSKLTIALSIALASVTSFGLGWYLFSPDTTPNQTKEALNQSKNINQNINDKGQTNQNELNKDKKVSTATIVLEEVETKETYNDNSLASEIKKLDIALKTADEPQEEKAFNENSFGKLAREDEKVKDTPEVQEMGIAINEAPNLKFEETNSFGENSNEIIEANSPTIYPIESSMNRTEIEKYDLLGLNAIDIKSEIKSLNLDESFKNSNYYELSFGVQAYSSLNSPDRELNLGAALMVRKQVLKSILVGAGIQFEQVETNHASSSTIISEIETQYENSFLKTDYLEKTRLVEGVLYYQGVPFKAMVEETYFDTVSTTVTEILTRTEQDTLLIDITNKYKAQYLDIPLEAAYAFSFGKMDLRFSVSPSIGFLMNSSSSLNEPTNGLTIPKQRIMFGGSAQWGYYLSPKLNLNAGFGYRKNLNTLVGDGNQIGGNVGLRYTF